MSGPVRAPTVDKKTQVSISKRLQVHVHVCHVCLYWEHVCTELILKHCLMGLLHSSKVFSKHLVMSDIVGDADLFLNYANAIHNPLSGYVCECK